MTRELKFGASTGDSEEKRLDPQDPHMYSTLTKPDQKVST